MFMYRIREDLETQNSKAFHRRPRTVLRLSARWILIIYSTFSLLIGPILLGSVKHDFSLLFQAEIIFFSAITLLAAAWKIKHLLELLRGMTELFLILSFFAISVVTVVISIDFYMIKYHSIDSFFPNAYIVQILLLFSAVAFIIQYLLIDLMIEEIQSEEVDEWNGRGTFV